MSGTFSEDEARQIFARAAERQHQAADQGPGLSMQELEEIGRAAGLDPAHVAAAAAELRAPAARPARTAYGVDLTPRAERVVPGPMTDELWSRTVARLRRTFTAKGVAGEVGTMREWSSGEASNLHLTAEPVDGGTRVVLETRKGTDAIQAPLWAGGSFASLFLLLGVARGKLADPIVWGFILVFALGGIALAFASRRSLARWSETRQGQFDALLDQIELDVRTDAGEATAEATPEARIDPTLLDDAPEPPEPDAKRRRLRS